MRDDYANDEKKDENTANAMSAYDEDDDDGPVPAEANFDLPLQTSISNEVKQDEPS